MLEVFKSDFWDGELFKYKHYLSRLLCFYRTQMVSDNVATYAGLSVISTILSATMRFVTDKIIYSGESIGDPSSWVDISKCGKPWLEFEVTTTNYGGIRLKAIVDYGRPVGNQMMQVRQQTFSMMREVEYSPEVNLFIMDLSRAYGGYMRLRTIENTGAVDATISVKGPGSFKSYEGV